jgi:hypothetical protein
MELGTRIKELGNNCQDIVDKNDCHEIVGWKLGNDISRDALTSILAVIVIDTCILQPGFYPEKVSAFVLGHR